MIKKLAVAVAIIMWVSGCVSTTNTYNITGNENNISTTDSISTAKSTEDLLDLAGSAYGDARTNEGR
jgi:hypothetical protein